MIDWRAPVAEPFYRATGRDPMGIARRRHFAVEGQQLLGIEDELFGEGHLGVGHDEGLDGRPDVGRADANCRGYSHAAGRRSNAAAPGTLGDIVATIQGEQDEIIRSPAGRRARRAGRPGHRQDRRRAPPRRLPALHPPVPARGPGRARHRARTGCSCATSSRCCRRSARPASSRWCSPIWSPTSSSCGPAPRATTRRPRHGSRATPRMSDMIDQAISDRQRPLRDDLVAAVPHRVRPPARRRVGAHRAHGPPPVQAPQRRPPVRRVRGLGGARQHVARRRGRTARRARRAARHRRGPRGARPDVAGAHPGAAAARPVRLEGAAEVGRPRRARRRRGADAVPRARPSRVDDVRWTAGDVALLDDARDVLGPKLGKNGKVDELDEIRTYGHIVIDEVQDLTPMQLKMATRRSLNGSMTIVGDIAQATGPLAPEHWDDVLALPSRPQAVPGHRPVGRLPHPAADHGAGEPGDGVRHARRCGRRGRCGSATTARRSCVPTRSTTWRRRVAAEVAHARRRTPQREPRRGRPRPARSATCPRRSRDAGVNHGTATRTGLDAGVTLVPVSVVKGLELDGVVVVEPTQIVSDVRAGHALAVRRADPVDAAPDRRARARSARTAPLNQARRSVFSRRRCSCRRGSSAG